MNEINFFELFSTLFFLYAETHYSFKGIYSRLKKKEPEIIADLPYRCDVGRPIPVLILIKDAHKYPIQLHGVQMELYSQTAKESFHFEFDHLLISNHLWHRVLEITPNENFSDDCTIEVSIQITCNGKKQVIKNDNYACTSHAPFKIFISSNALPKSTGWYFGEFHCHTSYTSDQVEFGAPLDATAKLAQALGLSFYCATDHSYDLDDEPDNYLKKDPQLTKWQTFLQEIQRLNQSNSKFVVIPGEEVSAGNGKHRNVHFLILNHADFLPGAGDSAEKWFQTKPDLTIAQILNKITSNAVAFAAHPGEKPPFLQWLLVRRGTWQLQDCYQTNLHGLQIWNGTEEGLNKGKEMWIRLLLQGQRIFISGGNDAHGNFNRFRQIGIPFITMRENRQHIFGKVRTGVYLEKGLSLNALLTAFKQGRMLVTNGPFLDIWVTNEKEECARVRAAISGRDFKLKIKCLSTPEYGRLQKLSIYLGDLSTKQEYLFLGTKNFPRAFEYIENIAINKINNRCYLRAELYSESNGQTFRCFTNPIWITKTS